MSFGTAGPGVADEGVRLPTPPGVRTHWRVVGWFRGAAKGAWSSSGVKPPAPLQRLTIQAFEEREGPRTLARVTAGAVYC